MGHRSKELGKPEPTPEVATSITHRIALKPNRENALVDAPYGDSDPDHPKHIPLLRSLRAYVSRRVGGKISHHLSKEEVAKLVAPHPDTLELVNSWLEHNGVTSSSPPKS